MKEIEKKEKYLDLGRELKKRWNMKVPVSGAKGLAKGLKELEIRGQVEIIQTTALLRSVNTEKNLGELKRLVVT